MKVDPFFTIVIPTYNRADFILKCIDSVLNQAFQHFEIIIVDDGSTDNTDILVKGIQSDKIIYYKKDNEERAVARNAGIQLSKGRYVNFLDSDDLLYPNHLQEALKVIIEFEDPEFFHLGYDVKDAGGKVLNKVNSLEGDLNEKLIQGNFLSTNGVFLRKDIALKFPFNTDRALSTAEDFELWLRLAARYPLRYSNVITSTLVNHYSRSVLLNSKENLVKCQELFIKYLWQDEFAKEKYGNYRKLVLSDVYTYIALHLALTKKHRIEVLKYLTKSVIAYPSVFCKKRFWASLKNIF